MLKNFITVASITALLAVSGSYATAGEGRRCATKTPTAAQVANSSRLARAASVSFPDTGIVIPIAFHVIQGEKNQKIVGGVSDEDIQKQIRVLNDAYVGTGFKFSLQSIDKSLNSDWFRGCMSGKEMEMKNSLAVDPARVFNVYSCDPSTGDLGLAIFPQDYDESDSMNGVAVAYRTLPNGAEPDYDLGITLVHETGHYLGLYHTFEANYNKNGCQGSGDGVDDTAYEKTEAYSCPLKRDSCVGNTGKFIGKDPVINYMDYTDDACMREFTLGQIRLMQQSAIKWRLSLLNP